jgi:hypothetical protein
MSFKLGIAGQMSLAQKRFADLSRGIGDGVMLSISGT